MSETEELVAQHHRDNQVRFVEIETKLDAQAAQVESRLDEQAAVAARMEAAMEILSKTLEKHASDLHTVKGNMNGHVSLTQDALQGIEAIKVQITQLNIPTLTEIVGAVENVKGGARVLGSLKGPAQWIGVMAGALAAVLALYVKWKAK